MTTSTTALAAMWMRKRPNLRYRAVTRRQPHQAKPNLTVISPTVYEVQGAFWEFTPTRATVRIVSALGKVRFTTLKSIRGAFQQSETRVKDSKLPISQTLVTSSAVPRRLTLKKIGVAHGRPNF